MILPIAPQWILVGAVVLFAVWFQNMRKKWAKDIGPYYGPQKITLTTAKSPAEIHRAMVEARRSQQLAGLVFAGGVWIGVMVLFPEFARQAHIAIAQIAVSVVSSLVNLLGYVLNALTEYVAMRG